MNNPIKANRSKEWDAKPLAYILSAPDTVAGLPGRYSTSIWAVQAARPVMQGGGVSMFPIVPRLDCSVSGTSRCFPVCVQVSMMRELVALSITPFLLIFIPHATSSAINGNKMHRVRLSAPTKRISSICRAQHNRRSSARV